MKLRKEASVARVHDAYDRQEFSAVELVQDYLSEAKASKHNAFLTLCEHRALEQAVRADALIKREGRVPREKYPLLGIPLALKDNFALKGVRMTCASRILENYVAPYTATVVQKLEDAGAITVGKTNLDEFAMGGSNENSAFGPVLHPTHPDRVPGGSSGGSAAAVGAGLCVAALGSDTGGSIRLPAAYCGLVGVKPTYGRASRSGLVAFASSLDQAGPLAGTVEDAALLLDVMTGHDPADSTSAPEPATRCREALAQTHEWKCLKIGVPEELWLAEASLAPDVARALERALRWLENQGARLVPLRLPHHSYSISVYYLIAVSEASSNLSRYDGVRFGERPVEARGAAALEAFYQKTRGLFGAEAKRRLLLGTFALSAGYAEAYYARACRVRRLIHADFVRAFSEVDLLISPASATTAYRRGEKSGDPLSMYLNDVFTVSANLAGIPAVSLPCGADPDGLPIGLQFLGPAFSEERLLRAAHRFERDSGLRAGGG